MPRHVLSAAFCLLAILPVSHAQSDWSIGLEGGGGQVFCSGNGAFRSYFPYGFEYHTSYYGLRGAYRFAPHWAVSTGFLNTHLDATQQWYLENVRAYNSSGAVSAESQQQTQWLTVPVALRYYLKRELPHRPQLYAEAGFSTNILTGQKGYFAYYDDPWQRRGGGGRHRMDNSDLRPVWFRASVAVGMQFPVRSQWLFGYQVELGRGLSSAYTRAAEGVYTPAHDWNASYGFRLSALRRIGR